MCQLQIHEIQYSGNIFAALETEQPELILDQKLMDAARQPIEKMLKMSK